jgi:P-type E1-E2 ATPase
MSEDAKRLLRVAAAAEQYSTHPIAEAIVKAARDQNLDVPEAEDNRAVSGKGVSATVDGKTVKVGQKMFFGPLPGDFLVHASEIQSQGMTVAILEYDGQYAALGLRDAPRPEAKSVLQELKSLGAISLIVLTGDNDQTAKSVANELGLTDVRAGLLPQEKEALISDLTETAKGVMFVGDGINDAPSLARANVGVAMGGLGSDVALNAADVVLMQDNLMRLPDLVRLGRKTNRIIRSNLFFATGVIAVLTFGSVLIDVAFPMIRHSILPFAVVGHEGSTVLVILNGLRLLRGVAPMRAV